MRTIVCLMLGVLLLSACKETPKALPTEDVQRDSLMRIINQKDAELESILSTFNDIQEGFREINRAQKRVNLSEGDTEKMSQEDILENISFIKRTLQLNKERIQRLQNQLKSTQVNSARQLATIEELTQRLQEQQTEVERLVAELKQKDIHIEEQDKKIETLNEHVGNLNKQNEAKQQVVNKQDKELHTAWYVFGTKSELKEQGILQKSEVLKTSNFNKAYFTQIDTRSVNTIRLYSKSATLLTNHPAGSYALERDANKQYTLRITDADAFWSVSKYLVVQVK